MSKYAHIFLSTFFILSLVILGSVSILQDTHILYAEQLGYQPLSPLPLETNGGNPTELSVYLPAMFKFLIAIAGVLAVIMIVIGGVEYMSTDAVYGKSEGKNKITRALGGLLLALISWLILNTINPDTLNTALNIPNVPEQGIPATEEDSQLEFGEWLVVTTTRVPEPNGECIAEPSISYTATGVVGIYNESACQTFLEQNMSSVSTNHCTEDFCAIFYSSKTLHHNHA